MDITDLKILQIMQNQGRIKMKQLGEFIHLSTSATTERVKRLQDDGIITGYTVLISPEALGYKIEADIIVLLQNLHRKKEFIQHLQTEPLVYEAFETMGRSDAICRVACQSVEELYALASRLQEFGHTETYLHMKCYKEKNFSMPTLE